MELTRRHFLRGMLGALLALAACRWRAAGRGGVRRGMVRADRARTYPGPLAPLSPDDVRRVGPWMG